VSGGVARRVACPRCKGPSLFAPDNRWRPFCSERCSVNDLGAWASESYRVEAVEPPDPQSPQAIETPPPPPRR
jgi:uncharacterized protein